MKDQELRIVVSAKDSASSVIQKVQAQLRDSSSAISRGLDNARHSTDGFSNSLNVSARSAALAGAVAGATASAVTALGRAIGNAGRSAISSAADYEQNRIAFETMVGSADRARKLMAEIAQFAKTTPFELPEVVTGAKQLMAYGVEAEKIIPTFTVMGNIASGVGREKLPDLIRAFGQVRAKGKLMAQELNQFAEAGVPLREMLAKDLKMSLESFSTELDKGNLDIKFATVEKSLASLGSEGGRFGGLMEKQSKSFSGVVSNIKDGFGQILRSAVGITVTGDIVAGSVFDRISRSAQAMVPAVQRAADNIGPVMTVLIGHMERVGGAIARAATQLAESLTPKLQALWNTLQERVIPIMLRLWHEVIEPLAPVIGTVLVMALGAAIDGINLLIAVIAPLISWMLDNKGIVLTLAAAYTTLAIAMNFSNIAAAFSAAMATVRGAAAATQLTIVGLNASLTALAALSLAAWGAGVVAIFMRVKQSALETTDAVNNAFNAATSASVSDDQAIRKLQTAAAAARARGDRAEADRLANVMRSMTARATGGPVSGGRPYVVGERQAEVFTPNTAGRIDPNPAMTGETKNILSGNFYFSTKESVDAFMNRLDKTTRLAKVGMG